ncbi:MAG: glycoside hydrolase family 125 protein [Ignavibacteriae bacterium]|nr:glycoside hydrolase family 125 protein [Ignavibacteriota bacterium]MCB9208927.1 glycoside hydrolase family 125 protein [Ignavibacteriales bacterium]MCB9218155.1 glycoside hydrolase family 125 protein [Ignavibacteriales bacterium]
MNRRKFIKSTAAISSIPLLGINFSKELFASQNFTSQRPKLNERNFTSEAVESTIKKVKKAISDEELSWMFENCFPNTLDTTVKFEEINGKPDTFVITGDINAMWLRDSSAQVWPYLKLIKNDEPLRKLIAGVINRQTKCILIDPYANAFNYSNEGSQWEKDLTDMKPELHERKWEIDSLCYPIRLAHGYWKETNDKSVFDESWINAMKLVVQTFIEQQRKEDVGPYKFQRYTAVSTDTVPLSGYGNPAKPNGLINSSFRPSDDSCIYNYLVPSNLFALRSLQQMKELLQSISNNELDGQINKLIDELEESIYKYTVSDHLDYGKVFAYEVDGFGNMLFMDDANIPSLLSLPYLGAVKADDEIYQNTRNFVLSQDNPYFFKGEFAEGIGGPHVGLNMIWPMAITMRALTSNDEEEIKVCLSTLKKTHGGTGFMHETFHKDDPKNFTRKWFAWANTLFGELILTLYDKKPHLLKNVY